MVDSVFKIAAICVLSACLFGVEASDGTGPREPINSIAGRLLQPKRDERASALLELHQQQAAARKAIVLALEEGLKQHVTDTGFMSPLHCAIEAASACRVFEAEALLVSVVGYELDRSSFPVGGLPVTSSFYPAADALVELRVDSRKVVNAICARPGTDKEIQLLTWVLANRTGSLNEAKRTLHDNAKHDNIDRALAYLESSEDITDLLSFPDDYE